MSQSFNFQSIETTKMIKITFFEFEPEGEDENQITIGYMHHAPRVGEKIWLLPQSGRKSDFEVMEVCHWVSDHITDGYHAVAVYMRPMK